MSIYNKNISVVLMDIDGTVKDLVKENTDALIRTMKKLNNVDETIRGKLVFGVNKINMYLVKTGLLPTNYTMQNILLHIYSFMTFKSFKRFKSVYFKEYNREHIFFSNSKDILKDIYDNDMRMYFVTKNEQNESILGCKELEKFRYKMKLIVGKRGITKYSVYKEFMRKRGFRKYEVLMVGDNLFDDVIPAILLGINVVWRDMYDCRLKRIVLNILRIFTKKVIKEKY